MSTPVVPGRINLITDQEVSMRDLAEKMNFAGFSAALYRDVMQNTCTLSVPLEQAARAKAFLDEYFTASSETRKEEDMAKYHSVNQTFLPPFLSAMEKRKDKTNSAFFFLFAGVVLIAVSHTEVLSERGQTTSYLFLGLVFLIFGVNTFIHANDLKYAAEYEHFLLEKVSEWFFSTYTSEELDHILSSCMGSETFLTLSQEKLHELRLSAIRDYIDREFGIADTDWLNWLSESIYSRCYPLAEGKMIN